MDKSSTLLTSLPTPVFWYGLVVGQEFSIPASNPADLLLKGDGSGGPVKISLERVGPAKKGGMRTVSFKVGGAVQNVEVKDSVAGNDFDGPMAAAGNALEVRCVSVLFCSSSSSSIWCLHVCVGYIKSWLVAWAYTVLLNACRFPRCDVVLGLVSFTLTEDWKPLVLNSAFHPALHQWVFTPSCCFVSNSGFRNKDTVAATGRASERKTFDLFSRLITRTSTAPMPWVTCFPPPYGCCDVRVPREQVGSPMPGVVEKVLVAAGASVSEGDVVAIVSAMKMEVQVKALSGGTVASVSVEEGGKVIEGALMVTLKE